MCDRTWPEYPKLPFQRLKKVSQENPSILSTSSAWPSGSSAFFWLAPSQQRIYFTKVRWLMKALERVLSTWTPYLHIECTINNGLPQPIVALEWRTRRKADSQTDREGTVSYPFPKNEPYNRYGDKVEGESWRSFLARVIRCGMTLHERCTSFTAIIFRELIIALV